VAGDQIVDVQAMDEYDWRAWLRSVTPFIDGEATREEFAERPTIMRMACPDKTRDGETWCFLHTREAENEFHLFTLHAHSHGDETVSFYGVHTSILKSEKGRIAEILYWPHMGALLRRLGEPYATSFIQDGFDGHHSGWLRDDALTIPACRVMGPNFHFFGRIQHEINAAWFYEPADLEREALREESEKANPAPSSTGRASNRL
jgi:hypothetical protein